MVGVDALELRVLGPVEATWRGDRVALDRPLERALAVRLALAAGAAVSDAALARDLWGNTDLNRPAERLRVLASRLRTALGPAAAALSRAAGGYALRAAAVDLIAAESALERARAAAAAARHDAARGAAIEALALWRGDALADLRAVPYVSREAPRLDALRVELEVERQRAALELGDAAGAVSALERLASADALHEALTRLLAVALYRSGRQAEALERLSQLRAALAEELGVDPAPETADLELRILRHDPSLAPVPRARVTTFDAARPSSTTRFVGREGELAALVSQLTAPGLVTLVGPPGTGKTRLAAEIAEAMTRRGRRVAWVDLAPLHDDHAVLPAVLAASGAELGRDDVTSRLAEALAGALLVVDNAEHLVTSVAALVGELSRSVPELSVVVTSQRPLLIAGEELHTVAPLPPSAAADLFCARAGVARDARVDAICAAVDHLPLGIELAAGLLRTLTLDQIVQRIDDRMRLLVGGSRDAGERHTSLRAALDWSFGLLDATAQTVLRRLAVFAGGCTLEAAERVVAGAGVESADVAPALAGLVDRSLVTVSPGPRFVLLESVRDYALRRLSESGDEAAARREHLAWCREHVAAHDVQGDDEAGALDAIYAEWPNLLAALEEAPGTERAADALRLAIALDDPWMFRGMHDEARRHYAALVDAPGVSAGERAGGLSNYGFVSALVGETQLAAQLLDRASHEAAEAGQPELQMRVLYHRGIALIEGGYPLAAEPPLLEAEAIAEQLGRERSVAAIRDVRATALMYAGDAVESTALHVDSNQTDRAADHLHGLVRGLVNEALSRFAAGDLAGALACADEGTEYAQQMQDVVAEATLRGVRGNVAAAQGDLPGAIEHFGAALAQLASDEIDARLFHLDLADTLLRAGDPAAAQRHVDAALAAMRDPGVTWLLAQPTLAELAAARGDVEKATGLLDQAEKEYAARGFAWSPAVRRMARARELIS